MGKVVQGLLGVVGLGAAGKAPTVAKTAVKDVTDAAAGSKSARAALYATEGGVAGQELSSGQVKKRDTLLGN